MRACSASVLGLGFFFLGTAAAAAGEHAGGSNKLKLVSVADEPDPFSPPVTGEVEIRAEFEARPTDAGAGSGKNEKAFAIRASVEIASEAGEIVRSLSEESAFSFPKMPASGYHAVAVTVGWDGRDDAGEPVPDSEYTYTLWGALLREDVLGNGKTQVHLVGRSGILTGTVTVDSTPPEKPTLPPGEEEVVWVLPGQETVTLLVQVASDVVDVKVEAEEPLVVVSVTMDGTLVEIVVDVTGLGSPVEAKVTVWPVDDADNKGEPFVFTIRMVPPVPAVWYVDADAPAGGDGLSWATAFLHTKKAMGAAVAGDEIWVAEGTYARHTPGLRVVVAMKDGVALYGGFAGNETLREQRDPEVHLTTLDGENFVYHVVFGASNAILDGFTVKRGKANGAWWDASGGGMLSLGASGLVVVSCTFTDNHANFGGGIYGTGGDITLTDCIFSGNQASLIGGGIDTVFTRLVAEGCTFTGNFADLGGGISNARNSITITNCVFSGNGAGSSGGGTYNWDDSDPEMTNCIFSYNTALYGGAIYNDDSDPSVMNCTFSGNAALGAGGGMWNGWGSSSSLTNCILWGDSAPDGAEIFNDESNGATVTYSDVQGGYAGDGNIDLDPLFVDVPNDDFHIRPGSPCIDAADGDAAPLTDIDGNTRFDVPWIPDTGAGAVTWADMGAYEFVRRPTTVWAWGDNDFGQLGDGTRVRQLAPMELQGLEWIVSVSAGGFHSLALHVSGTVLAWGQNTYGQLGDGTNDDRLTPVQVVGGDTGEEFLTEVVSISAGEHHSLALRADGTVWAWGRNDKGQLGDGTIVDRLTPVEVVGGETDEDFLTAITAVSADHKHSLAVRAGGTVWAWGDNGAGQLGDGRGGWGEESETPVGVLGLTGVTPIAAGGLHSLALAPDGTVWAWGWNEFGQLGNGRHGRLEFENTPGMVLDLWDVTAIDAGWAHSLSLTADRTVYAWGLNENGQLGDGTEIDRYLPVPVDGLTGIIDLAHGFEHSFAVGSDGTVWAWGFGQSGQLGDGATENRNTPVQVQGLAGDVLVVAGGQLHSLAVTEVSQ